ncbi:hypothetical protein PR202_gb12168 [Eleusine coracana subsp. coracana]|uniref:SCP domain-containing protein n=1 Tax=Eleusine coracana subsp. coracana TaxID=191504 RepID=A0AAV5EQB1_ELECO|nr:hypothetical protein PR202_gb12168 [Eleusine coracana subsp. coracana]
MAYSSAKLAFLSSLALTAIAAAAQNSPEDYLDPHNAARDDVGVNPLTWDDTVAAYAQSYAEQRRGDCALVHSQGGPYGENIFWGSAGGDWSGGGRREIVGGREAVLRPRFQFLLGAGGPVVRTLYAGCVARHHGRWMRTRRLRRTTPASSSSAATTRLATSWDRARTEACSREPENFSLIIESGAV